ncbi:MAG TPA: dihydrolipoamide acetyltransferase family protein [Streptosporangiaceae bacterium]|jgi:pyruvate dehydrogenase E2 component (dihydrolipoamide acetyltransferase)
MSELRQFKLPDVGEGLTEADIVRWLVKPGDSVTINQIIVEIETAKALVELPSPFEGVVAELLVPEGDTAEVGTPIVSVQTGAAASGGASPAAPAARTEPAAPASQARAEALAEDLVPEAATDPAQAAEPQPEQRQAVLVGYGVKLGSKTRRPRKSAAAASMAAPSAPAGPAPPEPAQPARPAAQRQSVLAKPPVRRLAKDLGIDLAALSGSGPDGRITRDDVQAAANGAETAPTAGTALAAADGRPREERIAIRGVRKHTAAAMVASAFTAPHVTEFLQIDITEAMAATARLRELPDFAGVRVSPLLLVARALLIAAARHPMINSAWDEAAQEIVVRNYVNLGIAAATDRGLVVPNVKDAQALSLPQLAARIGELTEIARAGKSTPADMTGGTITITNVGVFGVDTGTPILTPGEAAILAFGQVKDAPWVHEGQLAVRKVTTLALAFDHRLVDGDLGSAVLRDVGAMLTDPLLMLAWS